jgi:hypothetical protein
MATRKATRLDSDLIARKGEAAPAMAPTPKNSPAASVPQGTKDTIALTVRLGTNRYPRRSPMRPGLCRVRPTRTFWSTL